MLVVLVVLVVQHVDRVTFCTLFFIIGVIRDRERERERERKRKRKSKRKKHCFCKKFSFSWLQDHRKSLLYFRTFQKVQSLGNFLKSCSEQCLGLISDLNFLGKADRLQTVFSRKKHVKIFFTQTVFVRPKIWSARKNATIVKLQSNHGF